MSVGPQAARKEIFALFAGCWANRSKAIAGTPADPEVRYQGVEKGNVPGADEFWCRASTQLVRTRQSAHQTTDAPGASPVVFETFGFVTIQVFAPMKAVENYAKGELLAELAQGAFMATETASGVWFRNPRINELQNDGTFYRWNVIADYQFNQVKGT